MRAQYNWHRLAMPAAMAAVTAAGLGLAAVTTAASASAAANPAASTAKANAHWRVVARASDALTTIVAPAAGSAWALGDKAGASFASLPAGVRWNGHRWSSVSFPKAVKSGIACSGASSPRDVWALAGSGLYGGGASYAGALQLSGSKWIVKRAFTPAGLVSGCTVLSPTNIWVYGLTHVAPGLGTWRLRGKTWRAVTTGQFSLISASKVSAHDIWAMAADRVGNNDVIAHFNGGSWRADAAFAAALPAQTSTLTWNVSAINAVRSGDVWVAGQILRENSQDNWVPSPYVLHLAGGKWHKVARSNPGYYLPGAVSDGHGGWWSQGTGLEFGSGAPSAKPYLLHESGGHWSRVSIATPKGYTMQIMDVVHVPGSHAMLAVASVYNGTTGLRSVVLAYGQLPK
ncbi:MAG TPA: hypothetical protein VME44_00610 [Streptosporangiaceae bacterium]|nr:hypothetical protein [Streptosporangiaceae bacterium]